MPTTPEAAVKSLARLPANTTCPNCGTYSKYGFSTVCIKFLTFICNSCKTSHQAISHRCKSLTMSSWDHGEVLQLKTHGNEYCRKVWLGNAPQVGEGGRPKEGDDINVFKRFVMEAYENKKYYKEPVEGESYEVSASGGGRPTSGVRSAGRTITSHKPNVALQQNAFNTVPAAPLQAPQPVSAAPAPVAPHPVAAPSPAVDLLDFSFDSSPAQPVAAANPAAAPSHDVFDPFNSNPPASASVPSVAVYQMQTMTSNQANNASFDPFGNMTSTRTSTQSNIPVMNNSVMNGMYNNVMNNTNVMNNDTMNGGMNNMMNGNMMQNQMQMQQNMLSSMGMMNHQMQQNMMQNSMVMNAMGNPMNSNMSMMNNQMNMMQNQMGTPNGRMHKTMSSAPQQAMNMNIMQPMNNSISNNFGSKPAVDSAKKDPFAGLGF